MFYGKPNSSAQPAGKCHAAGVGNRMIDADQYLASGIQAQFQSRWANNNYISALTRREVVSGNQQGNAAGCPVIPTYS
jgi:hypothetical protein